MGLHTVRACRQLEPYTSNMISTLLRVPCEQGQIASLARAYRDGAGHYGVACVLLVLVRHEVDRAAE